MPLRHMRRKQPLLTQSEREELKSIPGDESMLIRLASFKQKEKDLIDKRRGDAMSMYGFSDNSLTINVDLFDFAFLFCQTVTK